MLDIADTREHLTRNQIEMPSCYCKCRLEVSIMPHKFRIYESDLLTIESTLTPRRTIFLRDIHSVEVYGKSIVPPLVTAIFILIIQAILFTTARNVVSLIDVQDLNHFTLLVLNTPILLCLLLALLRAKCVTVRISLRSKDRPSVLRFVPRSVGEKVVKDIQNMMKNGERGVTK